MSPCSSNVDLVDDTLQSAEIKNLNATVAKQEQGLAKLRKELLRYRPKPRPVQPGGMKRKLLHTIDFARGTLEVLQVGCWMTLSWSHVLTLGCGIVLNAF